MATLITNIGCLVNVRETFHLLRGQALSQLPCINNAYLIIEGSFISGFGKMEDLNEKASSFAFHIDAEGGYVLPSWCDSHTHLVFEKSREHEFVQKIRGSSYADIAAAGGGILSSAKAIENISEDELFDISYQRLKDLMLLGTGAIEIKSGYGLSVEGEIKMLRVIKRIKNAAPIPVKATFLGAHAVPLAYKENKEGYIDIIIDMLPFIAAEGLADYIDVFCESGFYSPEETERICNAGRGYGLKAKIHANQLSVFGGVQAGINVDALSVDHLESMDEKSISALCNSKTIGTILPTAAFFLRMQYPPVRAMIDAGCAVALASDFNPGSSPSGNMNIVIALSCIQMKMLPEEAINAATLNGAFAMEVENEVGSITVGKKANLIITKKIPSLAYLPYSFGTNLISKVMAGGEWL